MDKTYNPNEPDIMIQASKEFTERNLYRWLVAVSTPLVQPTHVHYYYGAENHANFNYLSFMMTAIEADLKSHGFKYFRPIVGPDLVERKE